MKKTLFTILSMTILTLTYGQEVKKNDKEEKVKITTTDKMMQSSDNSSITLIASHVIIKNKLNIEADSVLISSDKKMLTAYGTKSYTFKGEVAIGQKNSGICKYRLGEDILTIE